MISPLEAANIPLGPLCLLRLELVKELAEVGGDPVVIVRLVEV